ncbi:exo-alpha-bergamotene synthase-like [Prosopis cineraria]|uniref:exo-alpha-bergamotene synthase-like n=1 Tax=Prosopis cineraria TaxID=364024 RepID=UPI0024103EC5|nr:exo-alpha-bergamotene synthase-like [Prosopis cineraria]
MALQLPLIASLPYGSLTKNTKTFSSGSTLFKSFNVPSLTVQCKASSSVSVSDHRKQVSRRSGNFKPDVWNYDYIRSLDNKYKEQAYEEERRNLMEEVRILLSETVNPVDQLELIDTLQRLGLSYQSKGQICKILENIYNAEKFKNKKNLHAAALEFRLLRQHGYDVSTDAFDSFKDAKGCDFQTSLSQDIKGMISLYEASFLSMEDETVLEKAADFTLKSLNDFVSNNTGHELTSQVKHALEVPLHWRLPRWEARWFIGEYERMPHMNPTLLQLAKLDYNMVQAMFQEEVKSNIRWWERTGLEEKVSFCRCRVVDNYVWGLGMQDGPDFGKLRRVIGNLCAIITLTDDMYDVYGTLEELELFTQAILRWDANDLDNLPDYMKVVFFAIYNFADEVASEILEEKGHNVHSYLKTRWQEICKAYMVEARWSHGGKTPRLEEYLENGRISISGPLFHLHAYLFLANNPISNHHLDSLDPHSCLVYFSGLNFRLLNDLGSFQRELKTRDVPSAIQCYMNDTGASEEEAIQHVKCLVYKTWKKLNEQVATSSLSRDFNVTAWELSRIATFFYNYGDDTYTLQHSDFEHRVNLLIFDPIPI